MLLRDKSGFLLCSFSQSILSLWDSLPLCFFSHLPWFRCSSESIGSLFHTSLFLGGCEARRFWFLSALTAELWQITRQASELASERARRSSFIPFSSIHVCLGALIKPRLSTQVFVAPWTKGKKKKEKKSFGHCFSPATASSPRREREWESKLT